MSEQYHDLDIHPIPEDKEPLFINDPWLIDRSQAVTDSVNKEPEPLKFGKITKKTAQMHESERFRVNFIGS